MLKLIAAVLSLLLTGWPVWAGVQVKMDTTLGPIVLELDEEKAPQTVANFLQYARDGYYEGTIFHRVIADFMIQGGGFTADLQKKDTRPTIPNEAKNGLKNVRGSIAMARTADPNSATAQFFINVKDNAFLDYPGQDGWGYAVFGQVLEGIEVVDQIRQTPTGPAGPFPKDVPQTPVIINKVTVLEARTTPPKTSE
jgi:cyclophilin family peptidyl-prolyl cis-trans isomerase